MTIEIFRRREQKYLITTDQYSELVYQLLPYMRPDKFGVDGMYTVTSLYFESSDYKIYFETKNKLRYRQKLRLRIYNDTDINSTAFFEVKQKHKDVVNKRRMLLPLKEAYRYLERLENCSLDSYETSNLQVLREIDYFRSLYRLEPAMVVSYDRHALHCIYDPDLRITFDHNLRCRNDDLQVEKGPHGINFIDKNLIVLEVKVNDSVPLWLTRILQQINCKQRSASKFCTSLELLKQNKLPNQITTENIELGAM
ncbi:polyphosphate polymerase domain-containing protein [Oceanobacillus bengalensis]|uniref:Polyphosphate polymerase domain-containing protein n=2 Tax=Oceanobacillus bengalensis TaxID=1435466 RepID=A0A494Z3C5_9BACI|nr:polyphosphate polymerase domain-containing protein [Oceanobacillus bengalensis]